MTEYGKDNTFIGYKLDTVITPEGDIASTIFNECMGVKEEIIRQVIKMQDEQVRQALIKLGWTPPAK